MVTRRVRFPQGLATVPDSVRYRGYMLRRNWLLADGDWWV